MVMNPRIKELWDTAAQLESDSSWAGQTRFMEKFAELIVRECADISDASFHNGSAGYLAILKHFGVE
jgi:hypothetical protein